VVAVSNGNADVGRIGIGAHFRRQRQRPCAGVAKPDVRIFHAAAAAAGVSPEAVLHVGDDPALDVLGGLDAGMQTVWVNRDGKSWSHDRQPHATVTDLQQLCVMLRPDRAV
jgi:HAD superfamily hydrolase (TIGR01509 family)